MQMEQSKKVRKQHHISYSWTCLQVLHFCYQQAMSCLFPIAIFGTLALSQWVNVTVIYRYDLILLVLIMVQFMMYYSRLETLEEIKVICVFHIIGLILELFKVQAGSWSYPEPAYTKWLGVPLYSGFMYASVASYMCQIFRRMKIHMTGWPGTVLASVLGVAIYANFFTHHYIPDFRWYLIALVIIIFWKTKIWYTVCTTTYQMPLMASFLLVGFFIWLGENIATFFCAWKYPNQHLTWQPVSLSKINSWFLLAIVSVVIVAQLKDVRAKTS